MMAISVIYVCDRFPTNMKLWPKGTVKKINPHPRQRDKAGMAFNLSDHQILQKKSSHLVHIDRHIKNAIIVVLIIITMTHYMENHDNHQTSNQPNFRSTKESTYKDCNQPIR